MIDRWWALLMFGSFVGALFAVGEFSAWRERRRQ